MKNNEEARKRGVSFLFKSLIRSMPIVFPSLSLEITSVCNRKCSHCFYDRYKTGVERDMDIILIEKILNFAKENHVLSVVFMGAEPLIRFENLIKPFIIDKKFSDMSFVIFSNGDLLTEDIANTLDVANNCIVLLSLSGHNKNLNDSIRGDGSYENIIKAVNLLQERSLPYGFNIAISKENFDFMEEIVNYAIDLGGIMIDIIGYKSIGSGDHLNKMLNYSQEIKRYELKKDMVKKYPNISFSSMSEILNVGELITRGIKIKKCGCGIGMDISGHIFSCPFIVSVVDGGPQIKSDMSYESIFTTFKNFTNEYSKLLEGVEDCPLIEKPSEFVAFLKKNGYNVIYDDMLKEGNDVYKKVLERAEKFKELRKMT